MSFPPFARLLAILTLSAASASAETAADLLSALTLHASFDRDLNADFSRGDKTCYVRQGKQTVPATANEEAQIVTGAGRFGGALWFPKKGAFRPQFDGAGVLGYNDKSWGATVSLWLRLNPDEDLEPGYCDPVQIVGDDSKKGFIFCEWSKDESPRFFRFAVRPLFHIWNPTNVQWADLPFEKRPMVQVERAPFGRDQWTHVVFTLHHINDKAAKQEGALYLNGNRQGTIENWDLEFGWNPAQVLLILGASYVGYMDDLAVFNRALNENEVKQLYGLAKGVAELHR